MERAERYGHRFGQSTLRASGPSPQESSGALPIQAKWIFRNGQRVQVPDDHVLQAGETPGNVSGLPLDIQAFMLSNLGAQDRGAYASAARRPYRAERLLQEHEQSSGGRFPNPTGSEIVGAGHITSAENALGIAERIWNRQGGSEDAASGGFDLGRRGLGGVIWTGRSDDPRHPVHAGIKQPNPTSMGVTVDLPPPDQRHDGDYDALTDAHATMIHHDVTHSYGGRPALAPALGADQIPEIGQFLRQNRDYARANPANVRLPGGGQLSRGQRQAFGRIAQGSERGMWRQQGERVAGSAGKTGRFTLRQTDPSLGRGTHLSRQGEGEFFLTSEPLRLDVTTAPEAIRSDALRALPPGDRLPIWRRHMERRLESLRASREAREKRAAKARRSDSSSASQEPREAPSWGGLAPGDPYSPWGRNHPLYWRHGWRRDDEGTA